MDKHLSNAIRNKNKGLLLRIASETTCPAVRKQAEQAVKGIRQEEKHG